MRRTDVAHAADGRIRHRRDDRPLDPAKAGDRVERDSPLFEISPDKVDAEVPSPATGILADVRVAEGQTVAGPHGRRGHRR